MTHTGPHAPVPHYHVVQKGNPDVHVFDRKNWADGDARIMRRSGVKVKVTACQDTHCPIYDHTR